MNDRLEIAKLEAFAEAAYERAIGLERDPAIVRFLSGKASALSG